MRTATQDAVLPIFSSFAYYQQPEQSLDIPIEGTQKLPCIYILYKPVERRGVDDNNKVEQSTNPHSLTVGKVFPLSF
jgi:hypothetical protein